MQYANIRSKINSGDVLGFRVGGFFGWAVRTAQRIGGMGDQAGLTHIGIAVWVEGRLYSVEMDGVRNVLIPLSQRVNDGEVVEVYHPGTTAERMLMKFDLATARHIKYSIFDLARIGARLILRMDYDRDDGGLVCSTFVTRWLFDAGWRAPIGFPVMPCPAEVCRALQLKFKVVR